jgi:uncharacterized protein YegP (UPF0339 family)
MAGKFELKKSSNGKFFFNLLAGNGQVILTSEMYESKASAQNGIESVRKNAKDPGRFQSLQGNDGKTYFTLKAANHQVIGKSQMYASPSIRDAGIASVQTNAPDAATVDTTVR